MLRMRCVSQCPSTGRGGGSGSQGDGEKTLGFGSQDSKKRTVPLEDIREVLVGEDASDEVDLPVDGQCVTLLLSDGSAVGFRFDDIEERDTFALCISMFVDGRKGEINRRRQDPERRKGSRKVNRV
mmetsp:Transcript_29395/g.83675  ORF Transcript_29395/g.83675 Transcript_29395/m.83675 type:complete len:126 (+) Transcript_29395:613-990(+)